MTSANAVAIWVKKKTANGASIDLVLNDLYNKTGIDASSADVKQWERGVVEVPPIVLTYIQAAA